MIADIRALGRRWWFFGLMLPGAILLGAVLMFQAGSLFDRYRPPEPPRMMKNGSATAVPAGGMLNILVMASPRDSCVALNYHYLWRWKTIQATPAMRTYLHTPATSLTIMQKMYLPEGYIPPRQRGAQVYEISFQVPIGTEPGWWNYNVTRFDLCLRYLFAQPKRSPDVPVQIAPPLSGQADPHLP